MTEIEIKNLRQKISKLFVEYGRVKGLLEINGIKIETPQSVFLERTETPKNSLYF